MNPYHVIKTVSMTEKSTALTEHGQYCFVIDPRANKLDVKRAILAIFERQVKAVNIINRKGKTRRTRFGAGRRPNRKQAIITLKDGEKPIDLF